MTLINDKSREKDLLYESIFRTYSRLNHRKEEKQVETLMELFERKDLLPLTIVPVKVRRFIEISGYEIKLQNDLLFFPAKSVNNLLAGHNNALKALKNKITAMEWFIPPFVSLGEIRKFDSSLKSWEDIYNHFYIAGIFLKKYKTLKIVKNYSRLILDAILAYYSGLTSASITILIPVIEGVTRDIARDLNVLKSDVSSEMFLDVIKKTKLHYKSNIIFSDYSWVPRSHYDDSFWVEVDEVIQMLEALSFYIERYYYANSKKFEGENELNRHGILHGFFKNYSSQINFYKLLSFIDMLCFIIIYNGEEGSLMAPDIDRSSAELATLFFTIEDKTKSEGSKIEKYYN
ncbi:hypothetical protein [Leptospira noguchii]|uniref:Uncharacterized protein n=1 Tax=Leptospira noguchii serovar Panama str. CZ214 TaxID=1001595 RepID=T0FMR1_9LEPT|nr:hypothetical protein [Leptospira noguchii]EQA70835.1 hypothetical protein LEP1GSC059_3402 [Leptospira noguchii serovar Panama str. CZ214]